MPSYSRVDARIQEFKGRVLSAAGELFDRNGVEATKLDEICETAGVAKRTLCNHFPTKGDIVRALGVQAERQCIVLFDDARERGASTSERLELVFERLRALPRVHVSAHQRELLGQFFRGGPTHADGRPGSSERTLFEAVVDLVEAGERSELPPGCSVDLLAEIVLGTIYVITMEWVRCHEYDVDRHLQEAAEFLIQSVRK